MAFPWNCKILLIALYLLSIKYVHSGKPKEKDYTLKLKGWQKMDVDNNPYIDFKAVKMKKLNRTHYAMDGTFEVLRDDISKEDLLLTILGAQKKSNGFQQSSLVLLEKQNFCDYMKNEKIIMEDIVNAINITKDFKCPVPKSVYALTDYIPDPSNMPDSIPEDSWRISLVNQIGDTILSGIHVFVDVKKKRPGE